MVVRNCVASVKIFLICSVYATWTFFCYDTKKKLRAGQSVKISRAGNKSCWINCISRSDKIVAFFCMSDRLFIVWQREKGQIYFILRLMTLGGSVGGVLGVVLDKHPPRRNAFVQRDCSRLGGVFGQKTIKGILLLSCMPIRVVRVIENQYSAFFAGLSQLAGRQRISFLRYDFTILRYGVWW